MVVSFYSFKFQANTTSIINYSVISSQYSHNLLDASIDSHSVFVGPEIKIQFQHLQPVALQGGNHSVAGPKLNGLHLIAYGGNVTKSQDDRLIRSRKI